jgi:hypothetical protein
MSWRNSRSRNRLYGPILDVEEKKKKKKTRNAKNEVSIVLKLCALKT